MEGSLSTSGNSETRYLELWSTAPGPVSGRNPIFSGRGSGRAFFYAIESCWTNNANALRRYNFRLDGFVSLNASMVGGEMIIKLMTFQGNSEGNTLNLNFSTSAAGSILVEIQDGNGNPFPSYTLDECYEIFGDEIERVVMWKNHGKLSQLA